jgi:hypothetical protein
MGLVITDYLLRPFRAATGVRRTIIGLAPHQKFSTQSILLSPPNFDLT